MNTKQLKDIIKMFEESSLTSLDIREGEGRIKLKRRLPSAEAPQRQAAAPQASQPVIPPAITETSGVDFNRVIEVTSPVVGVYYEAPEPGGKPFIKVGDLVQRGDILCLIEVMKQVTEVTAPQNGQVADICVQNGNVVEYGQTLVKLC